MFDEFEEFHLKCVHYVIAVGANGIFSNFVNKLALKNDAQIFGKFI